MMYRKAMIVSAEGGTLTVTGDEGEVLVVLPVRAGIVPLSEYAHVDGLGEWALSDGLHVVTPPGCRVVQRARDKYASGANPDWRPTSATRLSGELSVMVNRMVGRALKADRRERAVKRLVEMPTKPKAPEPSPVLDDDPAPAPAPAPVSDDAKE